MFMDHLPVSNLVLSITQFENFVINLHGCRLQNQNLTVAKSIGGHSGILVAGLNAATAQLQGAAVSGEAGRVLEHLAATHQALRHSLCEHRLLQVDTEKQ